jgi:hypothetical protein
MRKIRVSEKQKLEQQINAKKKQQIKTNNYNNTRYTTTAVVP